MEDLDYLYYRNRVALRNTKGLPYKTFRTYTSCDESQVSKVQQTSRNDFTKPKNGKPDVALPNINVETNKLVGI
jgi:hypothetical protein